MLSLTLWFRWYGVVEVSQQTFPSPRLADRSGEEFPLHPRELVPARFPPLQLPMRARLACSAFDEGDAIPCPIDYGNKPSLRHFRLPSKESMIHLPAI